MAEVRPVLDLHGSCFGVWASGPSVDPGLLLRGDAWPVECLQVSQQVTLLGPAGC